VENYPGMPYKILLWETNGNGNWDIAFSVDSGNGWTPYDLLFFSSEDELSPSFVYDPLGVNYEVNYELLYSKGNSVYFCTQTDSLMCEILFEGSDSVKYSNPVGAYSDYDGNLYAVAVREENRINPQLVYRMRNWITGTWSDINTVFDRAPSIKPKFVNIGWGEVYLSFLALSRGVNKNLLIRPVDFGIPGTVINLIDDETIETAEFSSFYFGLVTREPGDDFYTYAPFSFRFLRNDSTYIRAGVYEYYFNPYIDIPARVIDSKPSIGPLSIVFEGVISYTVWEDSADGKINLFGLKRIDPIGEVENEESSLMDFSLSQNYPNPFNPSTSIEYRVASREYVTLKVYDVLGREVATLVNEEKQPGVYEVEFNPASGNRNLASGIYYYRLKSGSFIESKKMIYLK
jgi:hypothetical protein